MGKPFWQSKTLAFNALAVVVAVAGAFGFAEFVPDLWTAEATVAIIGAINLALRMITREPVTP